MSDSNNQGLPFIPIFYYFLLTVVLFSFCCAAFYVNESYQQDIIESLERGENLTIENIFVNTIWRKYYHSFSAFNGSTEPKEFASYLFRARLEMMQLFKNTSNILIFNNKGVFLMSMKNISKPPEIRDLEGIIHNRGESYMEKEKFYSFYPLFRPGIDPDQQQEDAIAILGVVSESNPALHYRFFFTLAAGGFVATGYLVFIIILGLNSRHYLRALERQYRANEALRRAKEDSDREIASRSRFFANFSHELRTPLSTIIGFAELMQTDETINEENKNHVANIYNAGQHLLTLINDILDLSKLEANKLSIELSIFDPIKIVKQCVEMMKSRTARSGVGIKMFPLDIQVKLNADPKRFKQIILNLLSNAEKFTAENGLIEVHTQDTGEEVIIKIHDNGIGIAEHDLYKVISNYGQIDSEYSRRYEGTGLGLPLSKKLAELMGGKMIIESEVGKGTAVLLKFPKPK